jgi:hypothetical protein
MGPRPPSHPIDSNLDIVLSLEIRTNNLLAHSCHLNRRIVGWAAKDMKNILGRTGQQDAQNNTFDGLRIFLLKKDNGLICS